MGSSPQWFLHGNSKLQALISYTFRERKTQNDLIFISFPFSQEKGNIAKIFSKLIKKDIIILRVSYFVNLFQD